MLYCVQGNKELVKELSFGRDMCDSLLRLVCELYSGALLNEHNLPLFFEYSTSDCTDHRWGALEAFTLPKIP